MISEQKLLQASEAQYMDSQQMAFFRRRLLNMRHELVNNLSTYQARLAQKEVSADECDRANAARDWWTEQRLNARDSEQLRAIDAALERIRDGSYGYCEDTGEPIGIPRLLAYPVATLSMEAKARHEHLSRLGQGGSIRPVMGVLAQ